MWMKYLKFSQAADWQTHILTRNHWNEVGDPWDWIRERLKKAEKEGNPIERSTVSTKSVPLDLSDTEKPDHIQELVQGPYSYTAEDCWFWPQWCIFSQFSLYSWKVLLYAMSYIYIEIFTSVEFLVSLKMEFKIYDINFVWLLSRGIFSLILL